MNSLGPFAKAAEGVIDFILKYGVQHVTYIIHYKQNFVDLNESVKHLGFEQERIDQQCDEAEKNLNNIEGKVIQWVQKVNEFKIIVEDFVNDEGHKKARSPSYIVFPYLWNRHRLSRKAKKMEIDVKKLIDECPKLDEVSHRQNVTSNDTTLINYGFVEFGSTKSIMKNVMTKLEDSSVRMIGLYGPGGVGKSTLIKEIARQVKDKKLFDVVVKVEITDNPNQQKIQEEIAYVLGLRLEGEGENVRADCLRRRLKKEKGNTLLIFDDLWDKLDLNKLGIPLDDNDDDNPIGPKEEENNMDTSRKLLKREKIDSHKGCKILLTSRDKKVLCEEMDVKLTFCVKELDDKDALMLFQKLTGIHNEMSDSKQEIVKNYCAGLPVAIVTVARALRSKSESVWGATLEKLKKQELVGVQTSMDISVKMSYDHLENEEIKSIFLLCAQMGHQPLIADLVKYCFGLGVLEGVSSLWEARDNIKRSIQKLKDSGLLSDGISNNHFNMHDMVRDAVLFIANNDRNVFTLRNGKLDDWPELETCTSISICNCDIIDGLPEVINCPQLRFFQIDTNDPSLKIPENIFEVMKDLRVLILNGFHLPRLPSSIKCLLKLRMLCLERCTLDDNLDIIGALKKLRILSFSGSQLKMFSSELGCLDKLQLLDISDCSIMEINMPPNILSRLTNLEELYIRKSLVKMFVEGETSQGQNLFLSELKNLHKLKVVDLSIPCVSVLPNHLFFDKLKDYKIVVGDLEIFSIGNFRMPEKYEAFKVLALQLNDGTDIHSQAGIKLLFKRVESLLLGKVDGVQNIVNELNIDGFPYLKQLSVINNNHIKYVNSTKLSNVVNVFPKLESLFLYNLGNIEMISHGPITLASFSKLKAIKVEMCCRLENLYSFYTIPFPTIVDTSEILECNSYMEKYFAYLETIEVSECESLKEILQIPIDYGKVEFFKLHTLTLESLPSFKCFYTIIESSVEPYMGEAQTTNMCHREIVNEEEDEKNDKAPPLFDELVEIPNLESLNLSSLNIHKIWNDQHSSSFCFQNLIKLVVKDCDKLTYLCSLSTASNLKKLRSLIISECPIMERIFETHGNSVDKVCLFPKLEEIHLKKMNRLTDIWQSKVSVDSFSSLISVNIEECNKLDKIFPSHMEGWVESLENLKVSSCPSMEVIFEINDSQEIDTFGGTDTNLQVILLEDLPKLKQLWNIDPNGIFNFKKLRTVEVSSCDELRNLFPISVAKDASSLERMAALNCEKMVEIVASQDALEANNDLLMFPKLICVRLYLLPNIKHFYKGKHPIKCPKLKELSVHMCVKLKIFSRKTNKATSGEENVVFSADEIFPNLEYMEIDFKQAEILLPEHQMHSLKELSLISCQSVDFLYQFPFRMPNLEKLSLTFSSSVESVPRANISQQKELGIVLQLKELCLFYSEIKDLGFERDQVLQRLEVLRLEDCNQLSNLASPSVSFTYLTHLELKYCLGLKNLMASSTAKSMVQLQTMRVLYCREVEEIVSNEGSEESKVMKIVFSKLITIELVGIDNLTSFCSYKECEFEFPSLEKLIVRECLKMEKFSEREPIAPKLKSISGVEGDEKTKWPWEGNMNSTIQKVFNDKVTFKYTEHLHLNLIEQLWHDSHWVQQNRFGYLKKLVAWGCDSLVHVIPSHLFSYFQNLEELQVAYCSTAQFIFTMNDEKRVMTKPSGISRLKILSLMDLSNLEHVWDKDPEGIMGLQQLKEISVTRCQCLKSLFPASVAKDLTGLEVLEVIECWEFAEIFKKGEKCREGEGTTQHSVFSRLTTLTLNELPRLKYSIQPSKQQESLSSWSQRDIQELCLGSRPFPNSCFGFLESLTVYGCQILSDVLLPFNLLSFLTNLEMLEVQKCNFVKTIFDVTCATHDREITSLGPTLPFFLKSLTLFDLPNLKNIWNEDPRGILSMHCLQQVSVHNCEGLESLFPASIAKDVVVQKCKRLIAEDNRDTSVEDTFPCPRVRSLELRSLPKFKYFYYCSLNSDIYAHLESHTKDLLATVKCLSLGENGMEMILRGEFERKLLQNLKVLSLYFGSESDVFPHEILKQVPNVEKLVVRDGAFKEIFCCESGLLLQLKVLHLESLKELVSVGLDFMVGEVSFSNLTHLKVESCNSLSYLFSSSSVKALAQLKTIKIKNCLSIEEIVSKGDESDENEIIFWQLSCLDLDSLLNLRTFYRGSLSFPSLEEFSVTSCDDMITLCPGTLKADKLSQVAIDYQEGIPLETDLNSIMQKTFLKKISELDELRLESRPRLQEIWHGSLHIPDFCFNKLATLIVDDCEFLSDAVLPFRLLPLLPELEILEVRNCNSVKIIFDVKCTTQDTLISLPLKNLTLSNLSNLENIWSEDPHGILNMHNLQQVHVKECKGLANVFPASVAKDLVKLEDLVVEDCEALMAIVADESDENEEITFERLQVLDLKRLEKLSCFYDGHFTLNFPSLEEVHVIECSSMKTFSAVNKMDHSTKWYYAEDVSPRNEKDLNSAVRRSSEEEVMINWKQFSTS